MPHNKLRILYVDDSDDDCFIASILLRRTGYNTATAGNVRDALWFARSEAFNLFILDQLLPDGTGLDLCRRIRMYNRLVPIVFYVEDASRADRDATLRAGAQRYVVKPHINALVETVNELLSEQRDGSSSSSSVAA